MSHTRIKAKIFSKLDKPFGITFFENTEAEQEIFKKLPLAIIPFIGKSYQKKFEYRAVSVFDFLNI
jgi:nucleotidyltransferase/DNA polymerase involved in DNA repair